MTPQTCHPFWSERAKARFLALYDARAHRWPVASEARMIDGHFGQTFVRISGPATAPALVLLHPMGSNSLIWLPNIAALARSYRVFAVDHIGDMGRSINRRPLLHADHHLAWLDELLDALALGNAVHLAGLSYGGWLAAQYAVHKPQRLARLVLLAPAGTILPLSAQWLSRAALCVLPWRYFPRHFFRWLAPDLARANGAAGVTLDELVEEAFTAIRCFKPRPMVWPSVLADDGLRRLPADTLYMVGINEKIYDPLAALARIRQVAPAIQTRLIPGAGHDLSIVQAATVNREMQAFLES